MYFISFYSNLSLTFVNLGGISAVLTGEENSQFDYFSITGNQVHAYMS